MKLSDLRWLAGFLEGEGSFMYTKNGGAPHDIMCLTLSAAGTDHDVIQKAATILGARINGPYSSSHKHYKQFWRTCLTGKRAASWMMTLYPLMGKRRKEAIVRSVSSWRTKQRPSNSSVVEGGTK